MRQGHPLVQLAVSCRRGLHGRCLHGTEQITGHCHYNVWCACDCHPRQEQEPHELPALRRRLTDGGQISGCYNPSLPALWTHDDGAAPPGRRRRMNPLAELVELAAGRPTSQQQELPAPAPATGVACGRGQNLATSVAMDANTRVSKALECHGCKQKRQVIEWITLGYYNEPRAQWRLCAVCLLESLRLLLAKQITRQPAAKKGETHETTTQTPNGDINALHSAQAGRAVPRPPGRTNVLRTHQRRRRLKQKRRRGR